MSSIINTKCGELTVISDKYKKDSDIYYCKVKCSCGKVKEMQIYRIINRVSKSCGCINIGNRKHNMSGSRPYIIHGHMKNRCNNPKEAGYLQYGGRGIIYDPKWESFEKFWEDMSQGYADHLELDRVDSNGNYCKQNCRWADSNLQAFNTRKRKDNTSGCIGVSWNKKGKVWEAYISKNKIRIPLGKFDDLQKAILTRKEAELKYYGFNK